MSLKCGGAGRNRVVGVGVSVQRYRERFSEAVCKGTAMERELARDRVRRGRLFLIRKVPVHVHLFMGRALEDEKFTTCDGGNCRKKAHKGEKE